ncbi:MAG: 1-acyl-sn-glycerol-3-phosphate acyltransferase [Deltaproteobacteria bacterium]|nr:1-acyl-sn-glycerol-3-phosphate acyltransferase [Deltaproteobacteria bacterium]
MTNGNPSGMGNEDRSLWERGARRFWESLTGGLFFFKKIPGQLLFALENYLRSKTKEIPGPTPLSREEVVELLLKEPALRETLEQYSQETGFPITEMERKVADHLKEIAAELNYLSFPFWDILLSWVFNKIYEGLHVDEEGLNRIRDRVGTAPVVFIPNHRSHTDYLLLSYIFYHRKLPMPYVCAGNNLNFWPLGSIFRRGGAFFIRRSFEGHKLYTAALKAYLKYLMKEKAFIGLFIEGTRSRTGKLLRPRMGILSYLLQNYLDGDAGSDVYLVPTSLTYETVLEEKSYIREQEGASKKGENVGSLFKLRKHLRTRTGKVYIQFAEPLSLKELVDEIGREDKRKLTEQVALQVTYGINKVTVVTATSLAAMALLAHPKKAIYMSEVEQKTEFYLKYLQQKGCGLSEPLLRNKRGAIREAVNKYLRSNMMRPYHDEEGTFYVLDEQKRSLMDYYKNGAIHFFISLSCLSSILCRLQGQTTKLVEIENEFRALQEMFRHEFTFSRRHPIQDHLEKVLAFFEKEEWLRLADNQVTLTELGHEAVPPLTLILRNYFESYFVAWHGLKSFMGKTLEEKELVRFLRDKGYLLLLKEKIRCPEALSTFNLRNALAFFKDERLIEEVFPSFRKRFQHYYTIKSDLQKYETIGERIWKYVTIH